MKFYFGILLFLLIGNLSFAGQTMLMGRVTTKDNKEAHGAKITIILGGEKLAAISDDNGLYHFTQLFNSGTYPVTIEYNGVLSQASCTIFTVGESKRFYNFSIDGSKALVVVDEHDPFADTYMQKVKKDMITEDRLPRRHH